MNGEAARLRDVLKDCVMVLEKHSCCEWDVHKGKAFCTHCYAVQDRPHKPTGRWNIVMDKAKEALKGE